MTRSAIGVLAMDNTRMDIVASYPAAGQNFYVFSAQEMHTTKTTAPAIHRAEAENVNNT